MSKIKKVHRTGALGMLMAEGDLPTVNTVDEPEKESISDNFKIDVGDQYAEIDPNTARNWHLNDRPETELGDIDAFAKELVEVGQQQPCIVRPIDNAKYKYEIIAGERRWRAAKHAKINLKVIIKVLDDHDAAISQAAENAQRRDLSDYAKGMSFYSLLKQGILTRNEIEEKLGISNSQVSRLLSFADLPPNLNNAIGNYYLVTARTASALRSLANKSEKHLNALIALAPKISTGTIGANKLSAAVEKIISSETKPRPIIREVKGSNDQPLFIWKQNSDKSLTLSFSKKIITKLEAHSGELESRIISYLEEIGS